MEILKKQFNKITLLVFSFLLLYLTSCENILLGPEPKDTPRDNFEMLWKDFDRYYVLFGVKKVDWQKLHDYYYPYINDNTSDEDLWRYFCDLLNRLNDGHTSIQMGSHGYSFISGYYDSPKDFDLNVVKFKYLNNNFTIIGNGNIIYSSVPNHSIGYIYIKTFEGADWADQIKDAVNNLHSMNSIIIDIRENEGGIFDNMNTICSAFIDHSITYAKVSVRSGTGHDEFGPWNYLTVNPMNNFEVYTKKIVLLTNCRTASASDHFAYIIKNFKTNATLIGDNTWGIFSGIYNFRILPNGWIYTFSSQLTESLDGVALDSLGGIKPDIYVDNTEYYEIGIDSVLGTAINYLEKK